MNVQSIRCKGYNGATPWRLVDTDNLILKAARLWKTGMFDTADIAHHLKVDESEIWVRMSAIRKAAK